jgi:hypothetical protein
MSKVFAVDYDTLKHIRLNIFDGIAGDIKALKVAAAIIEDILDPGCHEEAEDDT